MTSARVVNLIDGNGIGYMVDNQLYSEHDFELQNRQLNAAGQPGIKTIQSTPDEQANDMLSQYVDKLTAEALENDDLEALNNVDKRSNQIVNDLSKKSTPIQQAAVATPKTKNSRQARISRILETSKGTAVSTENAESLIERALIPWVSRKKGDGQPGDDAYWVGEDVFGFKRNADAIKADVLDARGDKIRLNEMKRRLMDLGGYGPLQAKDQINDILNGRLENGYIHDLSKGVPNASADEGINAAVMEASGIDNWKANTRDPIHAVDHHARIGSGIKGIDSQRRFGKNINMSVYDNLPDARAAARELNVTAADSEKLWQVLDRIGGNGRGFEGKYMANREWNRNPSRNYLEQESDLQKDFLISSNARNLIMPEEDLQFFTARRHGPYNPQLGQDFRLINLNRMREELNNMSMGAIRESYGNHLFDVGSVNGRIPKQLKLAMSPEMMNLFSQTELLDSQVLKVAEKMKRRR